MYVQFTSCIYGENQVNHLVKLDLIFFFIDFQPSPRLFKSRLLIWLYQMFQPPLIRTPRLFGTQE